MTDQLFDPDRERDAEQAPVSDELLPDPGFDSAFFDAPSEEEKSAATGSMTRDTLFPADPIFFSETEEQTSDTASEDDSSVEAEPDPVPSEEGGEDSLESLFSGALFDPAPMHADSSEEGSVLFHVPESAREDGMTTAAFYAASELREDTPETASVPEEGAASSSADSKRTEEKRQKEKPKRPAKPLGEEELSARRRDAERGIRFSRFRFITVIVLSLLLAAIELLPALGLHPTVLLGVSRVPGAEALLDLQLLLLIAFCAGRSLFIGARSLLHGKLRAEGVLFLYLLGGIAYDLILYATARTEPMLCLLPLAVSLVTAVWLETVELRCRYGTLCYLSEEGGASAAVIGQGGLSVSRVLHVDGYDEHVDETVENSHLRLLLLLGSLIIGAIAGVMSIGLESQSGFLSAAVSASLLVLPAAALLSRRMYLGTMQEVLLSRRTALIGESAVYTAAESELFSIADTEAFSADEVKIKVINVYGDFRLDEAIRLMAGVYRPLGGPLAEVLYGMCEEAGGERTVSLLEVCEDGVIARAEERAVAVGSYAFMRRNSIVFPSDAEQESLLSGERLTLLYCAVDGTVVARFYVEYVLSSAFEGLAEHLGRSGVSIELRTADPCISGEYVSRLSSLPRTALRIRRVECADLLAEQAERVESCLFTVDRPRTLLGAWLAFRRYLSLRRAGEVLSVLQLALGAVIYAVTAFGFSAPILPTALASLYHVLTVLAFVGGAHAFRRRLEYEAPDIESPKGTEL